MNLKDFDARLASMDWFYDFSDDIRVFQAGRDLENQMQKVAQTSPAHDRLFRAYQTTRGAGAVEQHAEKQLVLDAARISVGVITKAELDAQREAQHLADLEAQRLHDERVRQRQEEELKTMRLFDHTCASHNWHYWRHPLDTFEYIIGYKERQTMLINVYAWDKKDPYTRIFFAWAALKNAQALNQPDNHAMAELVRVRQDILGSAAGR